MALQLASHRGTGGQPSRVRRYGLSMWPMKTATWSRSSTSRSAPASDRCRSVSSPGTSSSRRHDGRGRASRRGTAWAASPPALAIDGVSHSYGPRQALADVSLSIPPATFVVLLGLNGAGKSTLFSLITRLFATQHGQIRVFGHDIARAPGAALRRLGVVFQLRTLDLDLSVMQNLTYHAALHGIGRRSALERAKRSARASRAFRSGRRQDPQAVRRSNATGGDRSRASAPTAPAAAR